MKDIMRLFSVDNDNTWDLIIKEFGIWWNNQLLVKDKFNKYSDHWKLNRPLIHTGM